VDLRAREYVKGLCRETGLGIREDAVGNTFARWDGEDAAATAVATGSHIDAIPNAGLVLAESLARLAGSA